ncbi:hypothetical protein ODW16_25820, partial [Escherichia coli]
AEPHLFSSYSHLPEIRHQQYPLPVLPLFRHALPRIQQQLCSEMQPSHCLPPLMLSLLLSWHYLSLLTLVWSPHLLKQTQMMPMTPLNQRTMRLPP